MAVRYSKSAVMREKLFGLVRLLHENLSETKALEYVDIFSNILPLLQLLIRHNTARQIVQELLKHLKAPVYQNLRRAFAEWITRVLLRRIAPEENILEVEDLTEVDAMLAETAVEWTQQWKREGLEEMGRNIIAKQLHLRFGTLPPLINNRISQASTEEVEIWTERFVQAQTVEEVFEGPSHQILKPLHGDDALTMSDTITAGPDRLNKTEKVEQSQTGVFFLLEKVLQRHFGSLPEKYRLKLQQASSDQLQTWGERLLDAQTVDEVFADQV